jgi:hypothetical protein
VLLASIVGLRLDPGLQDRIRDFSKISQSVSILLRDQWVYVFGPFMLDPAFSTLTLSADSPSKPRQRANPHSTVAGRQLFGNDFWMISGRSWPEHDSRIKIGLEQRKCVRRVGASLLNMSMFN